MESIISMISQKTKDTANRINGLERPKPNEGYAQENDISKDMDIIAQDTEIVNRKFSDCNPDKSAKRQHRFVSENELLRRDVPGGAEKQKTKP